MRDDEEGYIVEYYSLGNQVKATAIDPQSGVEASIFGPVSATRHELAQLAVRKLEYMLRKERKENE